MSAREFLRQLRHQLTPVAVMAGGLCVAVAIILSVDLLDPSHSKAANRCQQSDATAVAHLKSLLDRTDDAASSGAAQGLRDILAARSFCDMGHSERAVELYRQADLLLAGLLARSTVSFGN